MSNCIVCHSSCIFLYYYFHLLFCPVKLSLPFFLIFSPIPLEGVSEQLCGVELHAGLKHNNTIFSGSFNSIPHVFVFGNTVQRCVHNQTSFFRLQFWSIHNAFSKKYPPTGEPLQQSESVSKQIGMSHKNPFIFTMSWKRTAAQRYLRLHTLRSSYTPWLVWTQRLSLLLASSKTKQKKCLSYEDLSELLDWGTRRSPRFWFYSCYFTRESCCQWVQGQL